MVTMSDVARLANVSLSTVSYVLTGARPISQATRDRVVAAMTELDYHPHALARGLARRRTMLLGLLLPLQLEGVGATRTAFVTGAANAANAAGYHLMLHPAPADDLDALRRLANQRLLDGAILMAVSLGDERVQILQQLSVPLVLIGRTADPAAVPHVDIDFDQTVEAAVAHLVGLGHRHIVYVNHSAATLAAGDGPAVRTARAFEAAMTGRRLDPVMVLADDSAAGGRQALAEARSRLPELSAVIGMNESALFGVLGGLTGAGLRVPDDVSVVSMVTDDAVAELATPALTFLESPGSILGRRAVEVLVRSLDPEGATEPVVSELLPCTLRVRGTSGPPPRGNAATGQDLSTELMGN
jgi:DNA-binding LacI/PurR family transcriptional regulator